MTAVSASPGGLGAMSPAINYQEASFIDHFQLAGRLHSEHEHKHEHKHKHNSSSNPPKKTTSPNPSDQYTNINRTPASLQNSYVPIDETAIFYSGQDFTPLDSATVSRVTSMSPEEALKAELDLKKDDSGHDSCFGRPCDQEKSLAPRDRSFSAPQGRLDLASLNRKLMAGMHSGLAKARAKRVAKKPTAQEWVSDIDCVSDIFGSMVADGDRGGNHL